MVRLSSSVCGSGCVAEAGHIIVGQEAEEGGMQDWGQGCNIPSYPLPAATYFYHLDPHLLKVPQPPQIVLSVRE